jgi:predicted MFS family arabinose efflux permease
MVFLVNLARIVFAPLLQPVAADLDVTTASLGVVTSAAWLGSAAPRLPTGYLLTRVPRHYVVGSTGVLVVGTSVFTALSQSVFHLTLGAFLMGVSSGMYFTAANPLVSELFPNRVGTVIGIHGMSSQIGAVVAPLVVSAVLFVSDWRTTFLCIGVIAAVTTVVFVWAARRMALPDAGSEDRNLFVAIRAQWPTILTGILLLGAAGFLWNGLFNLFGDYLELTKDIDPGTGRVLLSVMFAAGLPAFIITGRLADRVPNVPLLLVLLGCFVCSVFALTLVEGVVMIAVVSVFVGYFAHSLYPAVDTYLLTSLPDRHRASAYAMYSAAMAFTQSLGSGVVGTAVTQGASYTLVFQVIAVVVASLVVSMFVLYRFGRLPTGGEPGTIA